MGDWMDSYLESKDREYDHYNPPHKSVIQLYVESKNAEEAEPDDRSLMQVYLDSKDNE